MMRISRLRFLLWISFALLMTLTSCNLIRNLPEATETSPPQTRRPVPTVEPTSPPPIPTQPPTPSAPPPTEAPATPIAQPVAPSATAGTANPCSPESCTYDGTFLLARPISPPGRDSIDPSNRFGQYQGAIRDSQLGVNFLNSTGTPVLAVADGEVVVAGDDFTIPYAGRTNLYGNLVVLEHNLPGVDQPVFTLYGHLSELSVAGGDAVTRGQQVGLVGMSGRVRGSTFHFEIRLGENTYQSARNPELWLEPLLDETGQPTGALAGRILDENGNFIRMENILIERLAGEGQPAIDQFYLQTYANNRMMGLDPWQESFAIAGLPEGMYQVSFWLDGIQQRDVPVLPGKLTVVTFQIR